MVLGRLSMVERIVCLLLACASPFVCTVGASAQVRDFSRVFAIGDRAWVAIDPSFDGAGPRGATAPNRFVGRSRGMRFWTRTADAEAEGTVREALASLPDGGVVVRLFEPAGGHCDARVGATSILRIRSSERVEASSGVWATEHLVVEALGCRTGSWVVGRFSPADATPRGGRMYRQDSASRRLVDQATRVLATHPDAVAWVAAKPPSCHEQNVTNVHTWRIGGETFAHVILRLVGRDCEHLTLEGDLALGADGEPRCVPERPCVEDPVVILPPDGLHNCPVTFDELVGYSDFDGDGSVDLMEVWYHAGQERRLTVRTLGQTQPRLDTYVPDRFIGYRHAP